MPSSPARKTSTVSVTTRIFAMSIPSFVTHARVSRTAARSIADSSRTVCSTPNLARSHDPAPGRSGVSSVSSGWPVGIGIGIGVDWFQELDLNLTVPVGHGEIDSYLPGGLFVLGRHHDVPVDGHQIAVHAEPSHFSRRQATRTRRLPA